MVPPSGEQIEISHGDQRAVIVEVGAGLRTYAVAGRDILDGYGVDEMCTSGRGQLLIPWPNRIEDGTYEFEGHAHQLDLNEPANHNAIHGLVRWASWVPAEREDRRVEMRHILYPHPGYPFTLGLAVEYALSASGLSVRMTATNLGTAPCPYGAGAHPYLTASSGTIDSYVLQVPAGVVLESDGRGIPSNSRCVDGTEYDFRRPRPIGGTRLDHCFTNLEREPDGVARAYIGDPSSDIGTIIWMDEAYRHLMVFTGDLIPDVNRRSIAIEPMTSPPDSFRTGDSLIVLDPGESVTGRWGISPTDLQARN
jgi:aldose 1-epimerase